MSPLPLPAESGVRLAVLGELASGGMGRVDLARIVDEVTGRGGHVVAVKRLHPHLARDQHFVAMFLDEVRVTGSLRHANVVQTVGWGRDDEGIFLAMEFVHGAPLSHVARSGRSAGEPMPAELIAFVGARIATGLAAAHDLRGPEGESLGLIHRDVTPSNVLLGFDGSVKITDFGVAKAAGSTTHTATGVLKGKVSYMSPEYARGQGFDRRSDLYSTAVVLFELATGVRPFTADHDLELLRLIAEEQPPSIAAFVPSFNKSLADLIHRMLDKDPSARPADGQTVAAELDRWLGVRGYDGAALDRALALYVERHAADRRADVARLLESPGEITGDRTGARPSKGRTRTLTVLLGSEPLTYLGASQRALQEPSVGRATEERGAPASVRPAEPKTRAIAVGQPAEGVRGASPFEQAPRPASAPFGAGPDSARRVDTDSILDDARTEPLTRKEDLFPGAGASRARLPAIDDETDTGLVAPRGSSALPPALGAPARTRLIAAGIGSFLIVACGLLAVLALMKRRAPETRPEPSVSEATPAAPPEPSASPVAPPVSATSEAPPPGGTAEPPASASASTVPAPAARPRPAATGGAKGRCTPTDFDYPKCLQRTR